MKRHIRQRLRPQDGDPGPLAWLLVSLSLLLPFAGALLCLFGGGQIARGAAGGWPLVAAGLGAITLDLLIDLAWANPAVSESDEPDLNQRGLQLVGRIATVVEAIDGGRGKVRIGDTVWPAEGADMAAGRDVRIVSASATVLRVEPVDKRLE